MINRTTSLPDATTREQKKVFAVVSQLVTVRGKTTRHILIFYDHPATLALLRSIDLAAPRGSKLAHVLLTIAFLLVVSLGILWPLL
jgi:hypothetical protein